MVFREMFLNNQRQNEEEWIVDSEGNVSGGSGFNAPFVKRKVEQIRDLLHQNGLDFVETHVFSNGYGMQRAAVHLSASICNGYDLRDLQGLLSAYTGLRIGLVRVKFCNQCGTQMLSWVNGNKCPTCATAEEEMRRLVEPLDKPMWKERFDKARLSNPDEGIYNDGGLVKELLHDDGVVTINAQPDTETALEELLDGDSLEVSRNDYAERWEAEIAPLERLLPRPTSRKRIEAREGARPVTRVQEQNNPAQKSQTPPATVVAAKTEAFREPEQEGEYVSQKAPVKPAENEPSQTPEAEPQEVQMVQEEELEEEPESEEPSWMAMQENSVEEDESISKPVEGHGIVEGARVEVTKGPFKDLFQELGSAIVRLINKKKRVATVEIGQMRFSIPLDQMRPL